MLKRTLAFSNPAYLSLKNNQLVINFPNANGIDNLTGANTIPIEDIGIVILDHQQITISHGLIAQLLANNVALVTCNETHHPTGLMLNLDGHTLQSARFKAQIEASEPLKKQLWKQTIKAKITNQAAHLKLRGIEHGNMLRWAEEVKSGDSEQHEARASVYYWKNIWKGIKLRQEFIRQRDGAYPNNLLNYGYAIARAVVARSLVASGLLPVYGIFHRNQYNDYCLADDIMEPYRPLIDQVVYDIVVENPAQVELNTELKRKLLQIPAMDIKIEGANSPLIVGVQRTCYSLYKCFVGDIRKIAYPIL